MSTRQTGPSWSRDGDESEGGWRALWERPMRNCYSALQREWIAVLDVGGGGSALVRINQRAATAGRRTSDGVAGDGGRWMGHRRMEGSLRRGATSAAV